MPAVCLSEASTQSVSASIHTCTCLGSASRTNISVILRRTQNVNCEFGCLESNCKIHCKQLTPINSHRGALRTKRGAAVRVSWKLLEVVLSPALINEAAGLQPIRPVSTSRLPDSKTERMTSVARDNSRTLSLQCIIQTEIFDFPKFFYSRKVVEFCAIL